ncbi:MAG: hypothetical protein KDD47_13265 [Acidobacteria bacterium]|nr:hypothetical protein [Acidobacteriota bacterium]
MYRGLQARSRGPLASRTLVILALVFVAGLVSFVLSAVGAQEAESAPAGAGSVMDALAARDPRFSEAAGEEVDRRNAAISREAAGLPEPHWAGSYYAGDGLGVNHYLSLAPDAGFTFEWHGCLGVYERNWGEVEADGDLLLLQPVFTGDPEGFIATTRRFRWVQWGERSYLIPGGEVAPFCNGINSGGEPRAVVEVDDREKPFAPVALLPEDIRGCVLPAPVTTKVLEVEIGPWQGDARDWIYREVTVVIGLGTENGVFDGMELYLVGTLESGAVSAAAPRSATVRFLIGKGDPIPRAGATLSSRPSWRDEYGASEFRPGIPDLDLLVEVGPMKPDSRVDAYFSMLDELRTSPGNGRRPRL